ncbi:4'-phosphopantetheinyl transferase family protein [Thiothrix lacustris]|uniref:4'-phosphopantetheinyl transferase family protein n=1 Tax=Thiothrix lacustris TaxID=525917 RepID=UPI0027E5A73B|nr:4'-phosphopantetheinyl transferase superfamily protein [Thiothrix lacustris]WMP19450.1 4'-phosphopantetheinyl transferase superfamily protein [Thiothrix lacustris]
MKDTIHLYWEKPEAISLAKTDWLNAAEQQRANAFRFRQDRDLYVAAHIFLRQTLSQQADIHPAEWQFVSNAYGKPAITNPGYEGLQFNLSHTKGLLACTVCQGRSVGIDVERCKPLQHLASLCQSALSPSESADVLSNSTHEMQQQRFFTYWTLKEAYIKARGMGLSLPLQEFTFTQASDGQWRLHCEPALHDSGAHWWFLSLPIENSHHLALAVQVAGHSPLNLNNIVIAKYE